MTDKQIIIDGIDVSECIYYEDGKCLNGEMVQCNCKKVAVCYYKEYKRKEQECKNNKIAHQMELDILNQECLNLLEELKAKEQECESYKMEAGEGKEINAELKAENEALKAKLIEWLDKKGIRRTEKEVLDQCIKTLAEIKEIAKNGCYDDCGMPLDELSIILQKISECEGNDADKT